MNFHPDSESYIAKLINEIITGEYIPQTTLTRPRSLQIRAQNLILTQYYTYQQKGGNICGFYALFNVVHFIMYLKTKNEKYLDPLLKRHSCEGLEYDSDNIMDYSVGLGFKITPQQKQRIRHVLYYSPLIPGPKKYRTTRAATFNGLMDIKITTIK